MPPSVEECSSPTSTSSNKRAAVKEKSGTSTQKKRVRRSYEQLVRDVKCEYCDRAYASEHSMHQHIRLKHIAPTVALRPLTNTVLLPKVDKDTADLAVGNGTRLNMPHMVMSDSRSEPIANPRFTRSRAFANSGADFGSAHRPDLHDMSDMYSSYPVCDRYQGPHRHQEYLQDRQGDRFGYQRRAYSPRNYHSRSPQFSPRRLPLSLQQPRCHSNDALPWRSIAQSINDRGEVGHHAQYTNRPISQAFSEQYYNGRQFEPAAARRMADDSNYLGFATRDRIWQRYSHDPTSENTGRRYPLSAPMERRSQLPQFQRPAFNYELDVNGSGTPPRMQEEPESEQFGRNPNFYSQLIAQPSTGDEQLEIASQTRRPSSEQISKDYIGAKSALLKLKTILNGLTDTPVEEPSATSSSSNRHNESNYRRHLQKQPLQQQLQQQKLSNQFGEQTNKPSTTAITPTPQIQIEDALMNDFDSDILANFLNDNALLSREGSDTITLASNDVLMRNQAISEGTSATDIDSDIFTSFLHEVQNDTEASDHNKKTQTGLNSS